MTNEKMKKKYMTPETVMITCNYDEGLMGIASPPDNDPGPASATSMYYDYPGSDGIRKINPFANKPHSNDSKQGNTLWDD